MSDASLPDEIFEEGDDIPEGWCFLEAGGWDEEFWEDWLEFWYIQMPQHKTWRLWLH